MIDLRCGNVLDVLQTMDAESVHCIVTSPPYFGLRSYGTTPQVWQNGHGLCIEHQWETQIVPAANGQTTHGMIAETLNGNSATRRPRLSNTCAVCGAWKGELGLEPTPELYVDHLVQIFREARRVLRTDGSLWLNIGDSFASGKGTCFNPGGGEHSLGKEHKDIHPLDRGNKSTLAASGLKPKDLVGIPWMLAFALRADGWYLRSEIIWAKPNPMPESVRDRPTRSHEQIFLLTKSPRYFYDSEAIKEPLSSESIKRLQQPTFDSQTGGPKDYANGTNKNRSARRALVNLKGRVMCPQVGESPEAFAALTGRNKRSVWTITTKPFKGSHFATFPHDLIEPMILASTSQRGACRKCGAPWVRVVEHKRLNRTELPEDDPRHRPHTYNGAYENINGKGDAGYAENTTLGWRASCTCDAGEPVPATVLDPFNGAGTTGLVALQHGRRYIGIDLKQEYLDMTRARLAKAQLVMV